MYLSSIAREEELSRRYMGAHLAVVMDYGFARCGSRPRNDGESISRRSVTVLSVVIVRQRVRLSADPMTGSCGRSSNHRTWNLARLCINLP